MAILLNSVNDITLPSLIKCMILIVTVVKKKIILSIYRLKSVAVKSLSLVSRNIALLEGPY